MNELVREIEEDIRRERLEKLWNSFGKVMVGISIGVILITIAIVVWQDRKQAHAMEMTGKFIKGIDRMNIEDYQGALNAFSELTTDENSPYYGLAMLHKAKAQTLTGDKEGAARTYQLLSVRPTTLGEIGKMLASYKEAPMPLPDKDAVFYYSLSEWRAWQLLSLGKRDGAIDLFVSLRDDLDAPVSQRSRMAMVLEQLAPDKTPRALSMPEGAVVSHE